MELVPPPKTGRSHLNIFKETAVTKRSGLPVSRARLDKVEAQVSTIIASNKTAQLFVLEAATSSKIVFVTCFRDDTADATDPPPPRKEAHKVFWKALWKGILLDNKFLAVAAIAAELDDDVLPNLNNAEDVTDCADR